MRRLRSQVLGELCPFCLCEKKKISIMMKTVPSTLAIYVNAPWSKGGAFCRECGLQAPNVVMESIIKAYKNSGKYPSQEDINELTRKDKSDT